MILDPLMEELIRQDGSDLYLKSDTIPCVRVNGKVQPLEAARLTAKDLESIARSLIREDRWPIFVRDCEFNMAFTSATGSRFRVNLYVQRGDVAIVFRRVKLEIPSIDELGLPIQLKELAQSPRGLVIITGPTGSGKSTTQASMIDHRNSTQSGHIITIEDPVEFVYTDKQSIVSQREVGIDTLTFENALKNALRQAPDVISVGEIRDLETAVTALIMAETGHLVLATLHASNTYQSLERLVSLFTADREKQLLFVLSLNLKAIISQRLIPRTDGAGRVAATELLLNIPRVKDLIRLNQIGEIKDVLRRGEEEGIHSFDQSVSALFEQGIISEQDALLFADSQGEMRMKMKGFNGVLHHV